MTTTFQQVFDKIRKTYNGDAVCLFDVFIKQADGQIFWEYKLSSYRDIILLYFSYVSHYPERSIAITHYDKLVASAYWYNSEVHFKHFQII